MKKPLEVLSRYPAHDCTLHGAFESRASRDASRAFILFGERTWSWQAFDQAVCAIASLLLARGIGKGDRVAVSGRNSDAHVLMLFAAARIGAIMVPVNPEFGVQEARYVLHHAEVSGVVASGDTLAVVREACAGLATPPWFLMLDGPRDGVPGLLDAAEAAQPRQLPANVTADDTVLIVYTSGTTGFPKGAMHSQRSFVTGGEAFVQRVYLQHDDRVMVVLPLFHINALFYSVAGTLAAGCAMVVVPRFSASTFWQTALEYGATEVNIIEAIGAILANRPRTEFRADHKLRAIYGVRHSMEATFRDEFRVPHLIGGYGMTEIPGVTCNPVEGLRKPGSMGPVGRHPDPARAWAQCRVVDEDGRDVGVNEEGELLVRTPIVMQGYFHDAEQTREAFEDGWFRTGDLVRRDEDDYFFFVSRKKDIIRRRGENIAGAELDRVIGSHPAVHEAAAIAVPAELGEDEILVLVVLKPGHTASAQDIAQWCRQHLAAQKVPRYVLFVQDLPHTPTHKVLKAQLKKDTTLKARAVDLESRGT
ncbi:MAG: long-chain fatty acid--CoA ligase [Betaproteobacteria bacterium]|nr:long-chain fatty acid--CoA ligase [Betaproteobacteria bacterium]